MNTSSSPNSSPQSVPIAKRWRQIIVDSILWHTVERTLIDPYTCPLWHLTCAHERGINYHTSPIVIYAIPEGLPVYEALKTVLDTNQLNGKEKNCDTHWQFRFNVQCFRKSMSMCGNKLKCLEPPMAHKNLHTQKTTGGTYNLKIQGAIEQGTNCFNFPKTVKDQIIVESPSRCTTSYPTTHSAKL